MESPKITHSNRPLSLCGDLISMNSIIQYELERSSKDAFVMTHATNPLLTAQTISNMIQTFLEQNAEYDSLMSVSTFYGRLFDKNKKPLNHELGKLIRTQDLDPVFLENSCFYAFTKKAFEKNNSRIGNSPFYFVLSKLESIDIDDLDDWEIAEALVRYRNA